MLMMKKPTARAAVCGLSLLLAAACVQRPPPIAATNHNQPLLIHAARIFDGERVRSNASVLISNGQVMQIAERGLITAADAESIDLGNATLLPGFIELHAHLGFQHVPADIVLKHGITTLRDVGGPLHPPSGGNGTLRLMTSGPIITSAGGYPIPSLGADDIAIPVADEAQARATVRHLIDGGAVVIKVALEPGGEPGAPWSNGHAHAHADSHAQHGIQHSAAWPLLPENIVKAIVAEAHQLDRKVTVHIAEAQGAQIALNAGIDEWAHMPCEPLPEALLKQAVAQQVNIVSTLDTLSKCNGLVSNTQRLAALGATLLYGAEIAHPDIPWGIDAQELSVMQQLTGLSRLAILRIPTAQAGRHLGIPLLGTIQAGAPADLIAVRGDPLQNMKSLEYPDLVMSGGKIVVNHFSEAPDR